jgi:hypothetical protein
MVAALNPESGLKGPIFGAYTELYGGLSEDIKMENNGTFGRSFRREIVFNIPILIFLLQLYHGVRYRAHKQTLCCHAKALMRKGLASPYSSGNGRRSKPKITCEIELEERKVKQTAIE